MRGRFVYCPFTREVCQTDNEGEGTIELDGCALFDEDAESCVLAEIPDILSAFEAISRQITTI